MSTPISGKDISAQNRTLPVPKQTVKPAYDFLPETNPAKADVLYFAGCMTHLTPSIKKCNGKILNASGLKYGLSLMKTAESVAEGL